MFFKSPKIARLMTLNSRLHKKEDLHFSSNIFSVYKEYTINVLANNHTEKEYRIQDTQEVEDILIG